MRPASALPGDRWRFLNRCVPGPRRSMGPGSSDPTTADGTQRGSGQSRKGRRLSSWALVRGDRGCQRPPPECDGLWWLGTGSPLPNAWAYPGPAAPRRGSIYTRRPAVTSTRKPYCVPTRQPSAHWGPMRSLMENHDISKDGVPAGCRDRRWRRFQEGTMARTAAPASRERCRMGDRPPAPRHDLLADERLRAAQGKARAA